LAIDVVQASSTATTRGTRIVKNNGEIDKNAFLRILSVELSNQDPENTKDSAQYVAQMAQFASLEQIANLNSTMTMSGAAALIGSDVKLRNYDAMGNQYSGTVIGTIKNGNDVKLRVEVMDNNEKIVKEFNYSDVLEVSYKDLISDEESSIEA
jgi:flagellar basal-body rod modification protein FlgD